MFTYHPEGGIERPVSKTVLQEDVELLLDKPLHHHSAGPEQSQHQHRRSLTGYSTVTSSTCKVWMRSWGTHLLNSSSGLAWECVEGEEGIGSCFRLLEKAWRCLMSRRTTRTCSSLGLKDSWSITTPRTPDTIIRVTLASAPEVFHTSERGGYWMTMVPFTPGLFRNTQKTITCLLYVITIVHTKWHST